MAHKIFFSIEKEDDIPGIFYIVYFFTDFVIDSWCEEFPNYLSLAALKSISSTFSTTTTPKKRAPRQRINQQNSKKQKK